MRVLSRGSGDFQPSRCIHRTGLAALIGLFIAPLASVITLTVVCEPHAFSDDLARQFVCT